MNVDIQVICEYSEARSLLEGLEDCCKTDYGDTISTITKALAAFSTTHPGFQKIVLKR